MNQQTDASSVQTLFSRDEWRDLVRVRPWPILRAAVGTWLCIAASLALWAAYPHPISFAAAFLVIATRQHALNQLVHEAAHYSITRRRSLNDWISDALFATPHLISTQQYRQKHLLHHNELGDPALDTELKPRFLLHGAGFWRHTFAALGGIAALQAARAYAPVGPVTLPHWRYYVLLPLSNGALLGYCWWLGVPLAYGYLWLLPLFTLTMYISTLRAIAEHQPEPYPTGAGEDFQSQWPRFTRSIPAGALERFVFGPVNFCYHHEHHLAPGVPFANLPAMHRMLRERGFYARHDDRLGTTYVGTLFRLVFHQGDRTTRGALDRT